MQGSNCNASATKGKRKDPEAESCRDRSVLVILCTIIDINVECAKAPDLGLFWSYNTTSSGFFQSFPRSTSCAGRREWETLETRLLACLSLLKPIFDAGFMASHVELCGSQPSRATMYMTSGP